MLPGPPGRQPFACCSSSVASPPEFQKLIMFSSLTSMLMLTIMGLATPLQFMSTFLAPLQYKPRPRRRPPRS